MNDKAEGSALDWNNPKSGTSGTVTLKKRFTLKGHECREFLHSIEVKGQEGWRYLSKICLIDDTWKFLEAPKLVRKPAKEIK
jgi:surface antigen